MKRLLLGLGAVIVFMMYAITELIKNQNTILLENQKIRMETENIRVRADEIHLQTTRLEKLFQEVDYIQEASFTPTNP